MLVLNKIRKIDQFLGEELFLIFDAIQKQIIPDVKKTNVKPINISTSANISPAPCVDLSAKDVKAPNAETMVNIEKSTPNIISKIEIVFFILYKFKNLLFLF